MQMEPKRITVTPDSELDRLLDEATDTPVVLEKDGVRKAAIISVADLERFKQLEAHRRERFKILDEIGGAFRDVPADEVEREVSRAISEVRAENRRAEGKRAGSAQ